MPSRKRAAEPAGPVPLDPSQLGELEPLVRQLVTAASEPAIRRALASAYRKGQLSAMRETAAVVNAALQSSIGELLR